MIRRKEVRSKYMVELQTRFRAPIETEVFFLEDNKDYIKQNLTRIVQNQFSVPEDIKRQTKSWFNIMSIRNKKLLKCFPDYVIGDKKTSDRVKCPDFHKKPRKVVVAPLTCSTKFFSGKNHLLKRNFILFDIDDLIFEVNKDDSTIYMIAKGTKLRVYQESKSGNEGQLYPLDFYTPEQGFKVIFFNQTDNSIWLSNSKKIKEDQEKGVKNRGEYQQRLTRLNFLETPRARDVPLPDLSKLPFDKKRLMLEENRFGYSEFLSKYFLITDSGLVIFEDETNFTKIHRVVDFNKEGTFERCMFKFLSSKSNS